MLARSTHFELSLVRISDPQQYGKSFSIGPDGKLNKQTVGYHKRGTVERIRTDVAGLARLIEQAQPGDHLLSGVPAIAAGNDAPLAAKDDAREGELTRTSQHLLPPDGAGSILIDCDIEGTDDHLLMQQLTDACAALGDVAGIVSTSSSASIVDARTGEVLTPPKVHAIFPVADAADAPRALQVLFDRLWLAGYGRVEISKAGEPLLRTAVDLAMAKHTQPLFLRSHIGCGLEQQRRVKVVNEHGQCNLLNTREALPDLSEAERLRLQQMQEEARMAVADTCADVRGAYVAEQIEQGVQRGLSRQEAQAVIHAALKNQGDLYADFLVTLASGEQVTVRDILADPGRYHEVPCRDPLEPDYGSKSVAMVYSKQGKPLIRSFAHNAQGRVFFLHGHTADQAQQMGLSAMNPNKPEAPTQSAMDRLLTAYTVTEQQVQNMIDTRIIWRSIIALSHLSVWAAPANGGKTTIAKMAAAELAAEGFTVLFFQEDASAGDLPGLFEHAQQHGYRLLNSTLANACPDDQIALLQALVREDCDLSNTVAFFDTLKKYVDLMTKRGAREFFHLLRSLTLRGCTIVTLGHCNKHVGSDGKLIFEGVGDVRNDVDELFYIDALRDDLAGTVTMTLRPDKWRCSVRGGTFELNTQSMQVRALPMVLDVAAKRRQAQQMEDDAGAIAIVRDILRGGGMLKGKLIDHAIKASDLSRRTVRVVLDRYCGEPSDPQALWVSTYMRNFNAFHISLKPSDAGQADG